MIGTIIFGIALALIAPQTTVPGEDGGAELMDLADPGRGRGQLSSYTSTLAVSFDGTRDGAAESWSQIRSLQVSEPGGRVYRMVRTGTDASSEFVLEAGGASYRKFGEGGCVASPAPVGTTDGPDAFDYPDPLDPAAALPGFLGGQVTGRQSVDGSATGGITNITTLSFDRAGIDPSSPASFTGTASVAGDTGPVLTYRLDVDGPMPFLGAKVTGHLTLNYQLGAIGDPVDLAVPADCPVVLVGPDGTVELTPPS